VPNIIGSGLQKCGDWPGSGAAAVRTVTAVSPSKESKIARFMASPCLKNASIASPDHRGFRRIQGRHPETSLKSIFRFAEKRIELPPFNIAQGGFVGA